MHLKMSVQGTAMNTLKMAIGLAFEDDTEPSDRHANVTSPYYQVTNDGLIFYKHLPEEGALPFPYPMAWLQAAEMAAQWLKHARYPEPNYIGDGDLVKGFLVTNSETDWRMVCAIKPVWIMVGK